MQASASSDLTGAHDSRRKRPIAHVRAAKRPLQGSSRCLGSARTSAGQGGAVTSPGEDLHHRRRPGRSHGRRSAPRRARADRDRPRRGAPRSPLAALRRRHDRGERSQPARALGGRHHRGRPPDRLHVPRRVEHRRRDDLEGLLEANDDRRPHHQPRVPRGLARGPARRRLHRLVRGRDGLCDLAHDRRPDGAPDGRLRRRAGAARRVRRDCEGRPGPARRAPARGADPARLPRRRDHPRRPGRDPARRRDDPDRRPDRRDRLAAGGAGVERADHARDEQGHRRRHLRRRPRRDGDRPPPARAGASACA